MPSSFIAVSFVAKVVDHGCGQELEQLRMASPHCLGHVTNFSRNELQSDIGEKQASNGWRMTHSPEQRPATGHAMKTRTTSQHRA